MTYPYSSNVFFAPAHASVYDHTIRDESLDPLNFIFSGPSCNHSPSFPSSSSNSFPDVDLTEAFLRRFSGIREPHRIVLQNIPGPRAIGRLPGSTEMAVAIAIWSSPERMLPLQGIYDIIENSFIDLRDMPDKPWKRTIRHTLSLKGMFTAVSRSASGRGKYWALNVARSSTEKRQRKRRQQKNSCGLAPAKAASPESQISDLDHDYNELWLNNLHMQELVGQSDLFFNGSGVADVATVFDRFSAPQTTSPVGGPGGFSLPPEAYIPFLLPAPPSLADFDWSTTSNPGQQSDTFDRRTEPSMYHSYPLKTSMLYPAFSLGQ